MKKISIGMIVSSFISILILLVSLLGDYREAKAQATKPGKVTWMFATNPGPAANSWSFYPYPRFQKLLEKNSGGRFVLDTKMGLYPPNEVVHAVIAGRVEIGWERTSWLSGTFPQWDISLPFLWENIFEYEAFLNDPRVMEMEKKSYAEKGLVKIAEIPVEAADGIFGKKPIPTLDDFKGMKIRTPGLFQTLALKQMGAAPLTIPATEILEALKRGTVDATLVTRSWGLGFGLPDVCTHVSYWRVQSVFPGMLFVNKAKFDSLPLDLQKILLDTGREMQGQTMFAAKVEEYEAEVGVKASRIKAIVPNQTETNKAKELMGSVFDKWLELTGPYGKQLLNIAGEYAGGAKTILKK